jgi:hypothetical protein
MQKSIFAKRTHLLMGCVFRNMLPEHDLQKSGVGMLYSCRLKTNPNRVDRIGIMRTHLGQRFEVSEALTQWSQLRTLSVPKAGESR